MPVCIWRMRCCVSGLMKLERHCVLWVLSIKSDVEFRQVLYPIGLIKGSNWWKVFEIGQLEEYQLPWRKHQTSCLFADLVEIGTAWLGHSTTPALQLWIIIYFNPYKILLIGSTPILWKPVKPFEPVHHQENAKFWKDGIIKLPQR